MSGYGQARNNVAQQDAGAQIRDRILYITYTAATDMYLDDEQKQTRDAAATTALPASQCTVHRATRATDNCAAALHCTAPHRHHPHGHFAAMLRSRSVARSKHERTLVRISNPPDSVQAVPGTQS